MRPPKVAKSDVELNGRAMQGRLDLCHKPDIFPVWANLAFFGPKVDLKAAPIFWV